MKTKFLLSAGLLFSAMSYGQTVLGTGAGTGGGINGVHIGRNAGSGDTGTHNTIVGSDAGTTTTTNNNTFLGFGAGQYATGSTNLFLGYQAGQGAQGTPVNGSNNIFLGFDSGRFSNLTNTTGETAVNNIFIGNESGKNANGLSNTFLGVGSGANSTGNYNTFIGASGQSNVGNYNVFMGRFAGNNAAGDYNVCVGPNAGGGDVNTHLGFRNVLLGYRAGMLETGSDKLHIANSATSTLIYGEFKSSTPAQLKFNAQKVGIGYDSNGVFGNFPAITFSDAASYRLFVRGGILAYQMRVRIETGWADYVFAKDYKLMSLKDTEKYIANNGHLPNMPSAAEVEADGVELGNIVKLQQEKIEELTLHLIEQDKQIEFLKAQNKEIETLKAQMQQLLKKQ
ncbi:hypothetical protein GR160_01995 [Flavobacterium sp. Sd200]|uniref:hypothetical protein n=1 Tax=Flavobacterium sp. Sd200 TaxID=2692211 RepID=UPI001367D008|nr:hypothetical protein [Flavobacterium sp. Sd200]MXN89984.1 hypothetical protein [Flavobacterium sp. Sd200]